jgi:hypothetical protein
MLGDVSVSIAAGDVTMWFTEFWEPGGDVIHYQDGNNLADAWSRFVVIMMCVPGQPMLMVVDADELESRRDRRAPRPR